MRLAFLAAIGLVGCTDEAATPSDFPPITMSVDCEEFVRDAVPAGSDLRAIVAAALPGATILVGPGAFRGPIEVVAPGVTIRGTCPAVTFVDSDDRATAIQVRAGNASIERLTIRGGSPGISVVGEGNHAHVEDVVVEGATDEGILVGVEATLDAEDVVIRGTVGRGLSVVTLASADVSRVVVDGTVGLGVHVESSTLVLRDSTVSATAPDASGALGHGVHAQRGATVSVFDSVVEGSSDGGVVAIDSDLTIEATRVSGTAAGPGGTGDGIGFFLGPDGDGGRALAANNVELVDNARAGVIVDGEVGEARVAGGSIRGGVFATVAQHEAPLRVEDVDVEPGLPSLEGAEGPEALPVNDQPVD